MQQEANNIEDEVLKKWDRERDEACQSYMRKYKRRNAGADWAHTFRAEGYPAKLAMARELCWYVYRTMLSKDKRSCLVAGGGFSELIQSFMYSRVDL